MAKLDRTVTLEEILQGKVSTTYLDRKEHKAIIHRHIYRLSQERDFCEEALKMDICTFRKEYFFNKLQKILDKMAQLKNKLKEYI